VKLCLTPLLLLACSCASSLEQARYTHPTRLASEPAEPNREYCRRLDRQAARRQTWSIITGASAGAITAGQIPAKTDKDRAVLAGFGVGLAAVSGGLAYSSGRVTARWVQEGCGE
jgi:hypothetical protein